MYTVARVLRLLALTSLVCTAPIGAQGYSAKECASCAGWNAPHAPVKLFGNSYYVGTDGLSAILITSPAGHVLIDGGLPESAPRILQNIIALGFRVQDVKLILNSHDHFDHAGGIAELARASGATVAAGAASAMTMRAGRSGPSDPQYAVLLPFPAVSRVREIAHGDTVRVGPLAVVAHFTPGHTAGGTTWSWRACDASRCLDMVYADSQTPISDETFRFTGDPRYPMVVADFARGHARLEQLRCDMLITPHPSATKLWERIAATGDAPGLVDADACKRYAASARAALAKRLASEASTRF